MKYITILILFLFITVYAKTQQSVFEQLKKESPIVGTSGLAAAEPRDIADSSSFDATTSKFLNPKQPELTSITPDTGYIPDLLTVSISGQNTHFNQATMTSVWLEQGSSTTIDGINESASSNTIMTAQFLFHYNETPGIYDLKAYNPEDGMMVLPSAFELIINPNQPVLTGIDPSSAFQGETLSVGISGLNTHFAQASSVATWLNMGSAVINPVNQNVISNELIQAEFSINEMALIGDYNLNAQNTIDGNLILEDAFAIHEPLPQIESFLPTSGYQGMLLNINVLGENTHFFSGSNFDSWMTLGEEEVHAIESVTSSDEAISITFSFPHTVSPGAWQLHIYNDVDGVIIAENIFNLIQNPNQPALIDIVPDAGKRGQMQPLTIFAENANLAMPGLTTEVWLQQNDQQIYATSIDIQGNSSMDAEFDLPPTAALGFWDVIVQNDYDGALLLSDGFKMLDSIGIVNSNDAIRSLKAFPNPSNGSINVELQLLKPDQITVFLVDMIGNEYFLAQKPSGRSFNLNFDLTNFPVGVYYLKVQAGQVSSGLKIIYKQ
ncbi:MAG: T9SS type A sorting domain-containing protein [Bacteroidetes bacterium]|nr:T9SS type A sorting domain-containing protein [Bacteroidota bacterium]